MSYHRNNLPLFLGIAVAVGITIGSLFNFNEEYTSVFARNPKEEKIKKLLQFIEQDYVDTVNIDNLLDDVIEGIVGKLDPHSVYFPKEDLLANQENLQGNFEGIGVQFFMYKDSLVVTKVLKGGPSEKAGIKDGDRILMAGKDTLYQKNLASSDIVKILKGPAKTKVNLKIYRNETHQILKFPIERGKVAIKSIETSYMINKKLGYVKLERFAMTSYDEFKKSLFDLKKQGAKNIILDLRQNSGGFIHIATAIADEFLEKDKLIVYTKNNKGYIEKSFATSEGSFEKGKVYVLIDEGSASASEIVAGALQDNDKGTIVGRRSFGKGLVQQEKELGDGSAIRLTIAKYYTPTGRSIQKPYDAKNKKNYGLDYENRILSGELLSKDSIKVNDSLKYKTPKGKVVYGGGGIIPDVFVPIDTTFYLDNRYINTLNAFAFEYSDKHRKEIKKMTFPKFEKTFDKDDSVYNEYFLFLEIKNEVSAKVKKELKFYLKALIAQQIFDENAFGKLFQQKDPMILKVLELEKKK